MIPFFMLDAIKTNKYSIYGLKTAVVKFCYIHLVISKP